MARIKVIAKTIVDNVRGKGNEICLQEREGIVGERGR